MKKFTFSTFIIFLGLYGTSTFSAPAMRLEEDWLLLAGATKTSRYFSTELEISFIGEKEGIDSYLSFFLQNVDFDSNDDAKIVNDKKVSAGLLGVKGGIMYPLVEEFGLAPHIGFGWSRANLDEDPWFGERETSLGRTQYFLLEAGAFFYYDEFVAKVNYKVTTLNYLKDNFSISFGFNY